MGTNWEEGRDTDLLLCGLVGRKDLAHRPFGFYPSTNMAHAWEVAEYLNNQCHKYIRVSAHANSGRWLVVIKQSGTVHEAEAATAPLAICRAAILALLTQQPCGKGASNEDRR